MEMACGDSVKKKPNKQNTTLLPKTKNKQPKKSDSSFFCSHREVYEVCLYLIYLFFFFLRHLPEKIKDDVQLKNMSGQWFYEAKSKRHRDKIHGADIIRASMRRKPATIGEHLVWTLFWKGWLLLC